MGGLGPARPRADGPVRADELVGLAPMLGQNEMTAGVLAR